MRRVCLNLFLYLPLFAFRFISLPASCPFVLRWSGCLSFPLVCPLVSLWVFVVSFSLTDYMQKRKGAKVLLLASSLRGLWAFYILV